MRKFCEVFSMIVYVGKVLGLFLGTFAFIAIIYGIYRIRNRNIRSIPGLDAIPEAIGRAAEMGRPVHDSPGLGALIDQYAAQTIAGLDIIGYVARLCASRGVPLEVTIPTAHVLPPAEEIVKNAYIMEGAIESWSPDIVRFLPNQESLFTYTNDMFVRRNIAANIMVGAYYWEAIVLAEQGGAVGAMQIGGTARQSQLPAFVAACDYIIIGDEMFAASAYLTKDEKTIGSIAGLDIFRAVVVGLMILGLILSLIGSNWLVTIIKL